MKLIIDEKVKHRLIGLAVIISLGAIFAPAVLKKSSQHLENNFSVNLELPPKPLAPDVVMSDEKEVFQTIKVAKANLTPVSDDKPATQLVNAEAISEDKVATDRKVLAIEAPPQDRLESIQLALNQAAHDSARQAAARSAMNSVMAERVKVAAIKQQRARINARPVVKQTIYAVQLASFSKIENAKALVKRLQGKGYKANFSKQARQQGALYKVYVGHSPRKQDVMQLKTQLASSLQLSGLVVTTGVS